MLSKALRQNTEQNRLIRLVLVFALMFAAVHVALHGLDISDVGMDGHGECQTCRLNHAPAAPSVAPFLFAPLNFLAHSLPVEDTGYQFSHLFHAQWARAPPLF